MFGIQIDSSSKWMNEAVENEAGRSVGQRTLCYQAAVSASGRQRPLTEIGFNYGRHVLILSRHQSAKSQVYLDAWRADLPSTYAAWKLGGAAETPPRS